MSLKEYILEISDLTVSFDGFKAVNSVALYVEKGSIHVVIGPNGAGKTTLLDLICGKTRPTFGKIEFMGQDITHLPEQSIVQAGIGRKFQTPSIYPTQTVFENLEGIIPQRQECFWSINF